MTDEQLTDAFDAAFSWASQQGIESVAINGVANTDHGLITADNRSSDEVRAVFLEDYVKRAEQKYGLAVELISLNDVFIRNRQWRTTRRLKGTAQKCAATHLHVSFHRN